MLTNELPIADLHAHHAHMQARVEAMTQAMQTIGVPLPKLSKSESERDPRKRGTREEPKKKPLNPQVPKSVLEGNDRPRGEGDLRSLLLVQLTQKKDEDLCDTSNGQNWNFLKLKD